MAPLRNRSERAPETAPAQFTTMVWYWMVLVRNKRWRAAPSEARTFAELQTGADMKSPGTTTVMCNFLRPIP